ncbi:MAG: mechanosensitive ion channel family protein [Pseudomonadota bacterium]
MVSFLIPLTPILTILALMVYMAVSKRARYVPEIPLLLFVIYLVIKEVMGILGNFPWGLEWTGYLAIAADVILSWAIARIIFWILSVLLARFKDTKEALPKITRDFILFVTFTILFFVVLRIRTNVNLASLVTTSAALTVVIGLAVQATLSNFFSGLIIQAERPFDIGDWINYDNEEGRVVGISWKSTQILTRDHVLIYVPNSVLASSAFKNFSKPTAKKLAIILIGLEYGVSPGRVREVILRVITQNSKVLDHPKPIIRLVEFGDFAITYEIRFWHNSYGFEPQLKADINEQLWYALGRNHIRIPFPIRDVFHGHIERAHAEKQNQTLKAEIQTILGQIPILAPLSPDETANLARRVGIEIYGAGETIIRQGETGGSMYIIREGTCEASLTGESSKKRVLSNMQPGDFFGEISLLTGENRTADVSALNDVSLIVIDKEAFSSILYNNPLISEQIARLVVKRQQNNNVILETPDQIEEKSKKLISKIADFFSLTLFREQDEDS